MKRRKTKQPESKTDIEEKMGLFDKLPDACDACKEKFDKRDKSMVQSWSVVVREEEGVVRLYCPSCWSMAKKLIEEIKSGQTNTKNNV